MNIFQIKKILLEIIKYYSVFSFCCQPPYLYAAAAVNHNQWQTIARCSHIRYLRHQQLTSNHSQFTHQNMVPRCLLLSAFIFVLLFLLLLFPFFVFVLHLPFLAHVVRLPWLLAEVSLGYGTVR